MDVYCQIAGTEIPSETCERSQGEGCSGCAAPTRRCTRCGKASRIADAARGLCGNCVLDEYEDEAKPRDDLSPITLPAGAFPDENARDRESSARTVTEKALAERANEALAVLIKHKCFGSNQRLVAHAPLGILTRARKGFSLGEAEAALEWLAGAGEIEGSHPWQTIVFLKTNERDRVLFPVAGSVGAKPRHLAVAKRREEARRTPPIVSRTETEQADVVRELRKRVAKLEKNEAKLQSELRQEKARSAAAVIKQMRSDRLAEERKKTIAELALELAEAKGARSEIRQSEGEDVEE